METYLGPLNPQIKPRTASQNDITSFLAFVEISLDKNVKRALFLYVLTQRIHSRTHNFSQAHLNIRKQSVDRLAAENSRKGPAPESQQRARPMANGKQKNLRGGRLRWLVAGFIWVLLLSTLALWLLIGSGGCPAGKRRVNGTCVCPVLFSGSEDCTRPSAGMKGGCVRAMRGLELRLKAYAASVEVPVGSEEMGRPQGDLPRLLRWDTCAVVGSSAALANGGRAYGREIDSHSVVMRFNDAPTRGFQKWVGSTTSLRIQNVLHCGFAESPGELCMRYTLNHTRGDLIDVCKNEYRCRRVNGTHPMVFYAMDYWRLASPPTLQSGPHFRKLSAGFFGIALSLHLCGQVDVYGIGGGKSHYFVKKVHGNEEPFNKRHNWAWERRCLNELRHGLLPRVSIK